RSGRRSLGMTGVRHSRGHSGIFLHDGEAHGATRAMRFRHVAPAALGIGAAVEGPDQSLGAAHELIEAQRTKLAADDPEPMVGHGFSPMLIQSAIPPRPEELSPRTARFPSSPRAPWSTRCRR